jgi:hypothetical protein
VIRVGSLHQALPSAFRILTAIAIQFRTDTEEAISASPVNARKFRPAAFWADFYHQGVPPVPFTRNRVERQSNDNDYQDTQKPEF